MGYVCIAADEPAFPERLTFIPDPPSSLWILGNPQHLPPPGRRALALVGARAASRDGLDNARRLAEGLAHAGIVVVSGMARGIDGASHQGALDAGGRTIAVLGSGLDQLYPREHVGLAQDIVAAGAVVSEYPPDTAPQTWTFPRRNRLISGLADAVVVVEAAERSGALITASAALEQGKDVLVVPGRVPGARNRGGHLLVRDGAKIVETADDILQEMGWTTPGSATCVTDAPGTEPIEFTVDELAAQTGEPTHVVLARLMELELEGVVQRIGSARFLRVRGRVLT